MKNPTKLPYARYGALLAEWRTARFPSALALFTTRELSFSYPTYSLFERGKTLPTVAQLLEIAAALEMDPRSMLLRWLCEQVPDTSVQGYFASLADVADVPRSKPQSAASATGNAGIAPATTENSWVLGPRDAEILSKNPWLWEFCVFLVVAHPGVARFEELPLPAGVSRDSLLSQHLKGWIEAGYIQETPDGLRTTYPHLRWADSEWGRVHRARTFLKNSEILLEAARTQPAAGSREAVALSGIAVIPSSRREHWLEQLEQLKREFYSHSEQLGEDRSAHALVLAFGPWNPSTSSDGGAGDSSSDP